MSDDDYWRNSRREEWARISRAHKQYRIAEGDGDLEVKISLRTAQTAIRHLKGIWPVMSQYDKRAIRELSEAFEAYAKRRAVEEAKP